MLTIYLLSTASRSIDNAATSLDLIQPQCTMDPTFTSWLDGDGADPMPMGDEMGDGDVPAASSNAASAAAPPTQRDSNSAPAAKRKHPDNEDEATATAATSAVDTDTATADHLSTHHQQQPPKPKRIRKKTLYSQMQYCHCKNSELCKNIQKRLLEISPTSPYTGHVQICHETQRRKSTTETNTNTRFLKKQFIMKRMEECIGIDREKEAKKYYVAKHHWRPGVHAYVNSLEGDRNHLIKLYSFSCREEWERVVGASNANDKDVWWGDKNDSSINVLLAPTNPPEEWEDLVALLERENEVKANRPPQEWDAEVKANQSTIKSLTSENNSLREKHEMLEYEVNRLRDENASLKSQKMELAAQKIEVVAENRSLQSQLMISHNLRHEMEVELEKLRGDNKKGEGGVGA
ncbi:predicted protein [Thalassiosira pseudonana CCMP1335]|uniref:Uncharacterized protein n=1 Tax=Thalassiosira pseudonana TaxID=35128 RepID=B8CAL8_THAPS|nr:predicted protein [Thalassiosira pseudonana CCMP1335]EED89703.1 predicted protein [Thalassiosira pseudonana CCMP1335]